MCFFLLIIQTWSNYWNPYVLLKRSYQTSCCKTHTNTPTEEFHAYVLKRTIESCEGWCSLAGGLVQSGGEWDSCGMSTFGEGGSGAILGVVWTGVLVAGEEGVMMDGGGVCGVSSSSEVRAGLPSPDSLDGKRI